MPNIDFKAFEIIQGFKSFDAAQAFSFDDLKGGFYFVTGENQLEPSLGANGAGKSTLWDALCWVLFEKTPTKLKAGDIHCWGSKRKTIVSLRFEVDGTGYLLTRTWNPNKVCLSEEGEPAKIVTNDDIVALIGFDFEAFLYSVLISQFSSKFFDLKPSEKMEVFSSVMESTLACWLGFSDKAKDKRGRLEASISESQHKIANLEGQIVSLEDQDYSEQIEEWERVKRIALAEIEKDIKEAKANIKDFKVKAKGYSKSIAKLEDKVESHTAKGIKLKEEVDDIKEEEIEAINLKAQIIAEKGTLQRGVNSYTGLKGTCPTCLQEIDGKVLAKKVKELGKQLDDLDEQEGKVNEARSELGEDIKEAEAELDTLRDGVRGFQRELNKEESAAEKVEDRIEDLEDDIDFFSEKYDKKMEEANPYEKLESDKKAKIKKVTVNKNKQEDILLSQESECQVYNYWVTGFKDIRYMILSEALHELEIQINSSLARLGLCDWEILLSVDKVNKSKTLTKGFTVLIKSPTNDEIVPFEAWSGGEGQRLRLAGTLGMIDFISGRMGFTTNIEVYDEPTKFIGGSGIEDLIAVLSSRAASSGKKVFMIDHKNLETFGEFDGSIKVVKDEDGSRIEID